MAEPGDPPHGTDSSKASLPQATTSPPDDEKLTVQHSCRPMTMTTQSEVVPLRNPRRRQRSPESAISPASRRPKKRMRPASGLTRRPEGGAEERDETARRRANSPTPSAGSFEFDEDDDDEDDYEETREGGIPPSGQLSASASTTQPGQKPKRTRQLTTPQQAAVLHALLAQSRFPTTQMREEVGRQIGLSARKVQVWFQNQRQKAKKSERVPAAVPSPAGIPPQFGQYASRIALGPPSGGLISGRPSSVGQNIIRAPIVDSGPMQRLPGHAPIEPHLMRSHPHGGTGPALPPRQPGTFEGSPTSRLTGPGIPGTGAGVNPYQPAPRPSRPTSPPLPSAAYHRPMSPGLSFSQRQSVGGFRPQSSHGSQTHHVQLAPLQIDTRFPDDKASSRGTFGTSPSALRSHDSPVLPLPRHYSSGTTRRPVERSPVSPQNIPPPFTLEPNPVWSSSPSSVAPLGPPSTFSPTQGHSAYHRGSSTRYSTEVDLSRTERHSTPMQSRPRFDPVRSQGSSEPAHGSAHGSQSRRSNSRSPEDL